MSLFSIFSMLDSADRKVQNKVADFAEKANALVGVGSYQLSSSLFAAAAGIYAAPTLIDIIMNGKFYPWDTFVHIGISGTFTAYQLLRNRKLERLERERTEQKGDAISIDFKTKAEKQGFITPDYIKTAKLTYLTWVILDLFDFAFSNSTISSTRLSRDLVFILAQYFREVDHIEPTKKNSVSSFVKNLAYIIVPKPTYHASAATYTSSGPPAGRVGNLDSITLQKP